MAVQRGGAVSHGQTAFAGSEDSGDHVRVHGRKKGEPVEYRARQVIGADGPSSLVIRSIYPDYPKQIPWFFVGQKFHDIIECPLDEAYCHFWFHPALGHYTGSHPRAGRQHAPAPRGTRTSADSEPGRRERIKGGLVRGQLPGLRSGSKEKTGRCGRTAPPDQIQEIFKALIGSSSLDESIRVIPPTALRAPEGRMRYAASDAISAHRWRLAALASSTANYKTRMGRMMV